MDKQKLKEVLIKKACGYETEEVVDEYALENGRPVLLKQKINKKTIAPDLAAIKLLIEQTGDEYEELSEEELIKERDRLIGLLDKSAGGNSG